MAEDSRDSRFVSPPIDQLDNLRQPLTPGERLVFDFFNKHLDPKWEIYIHPNLNGLRPGFVLLNPDAGIAVFEVRDWDLDSMNCWAAPAPGEGKAPVLVAEKDRKEFSLRGQNPVEKIFICKQEIFELYCPRLANKSGFSAISAGIIFPFAEEEKARKLLEPFIAYRGMTQYPDIYPVSGRESLQLESIDMAFPRSKSGYKKMNEDMAKDLRNWLIEPDFAATQRESIVLDHNQLALVKTRTETGYRRIKGPAGSGKSYVLAARAAELIGHGKEVLVVTFNITMLHFLMDIAVRWPASSGGTRRDVTWLNFHQWCKRVCQESDSEGECMLLWSDLFNKPDGDVPEGEVPSQQIASLVSSIISQDNENLIPRYDAVLVDEGQDFRPEWWNALRKVCRDGGEMVLVADATQDIYDTARSWTDDAMTGAGFRGTWNELKVSYRMPSELIDYAVAFGREFLPQENIDLPVHPQNILPGFYPCRLRWVQTGKSTAESVCIDEIFRLAPGADHQALAVPDLTFLSATQEMGRRVVGKLGSKGIRTVHTFYEDSRESRRKKMGFFMGDARIKATTIQSFKGWESRAIVIYTGKRKDKKTLALLYSGLTRLKRHTDCSCLTVVSCLPELESYGKTWPDYEEK